MAAIPVSEVAPMESANVNDNHTNMQGCEPVIADKQSRVMAYTLVAVDGRI
jgi:hypothetical protein